MSVLLGNGDGTFQNHKEYSIGANAVIVATADMNSDGKLDLVSANFNDNTVSLLLGNGDGTFKGETVYPTNAGPSGVAIADFNGNGKLDIAAVANTAGKVSVLTDNFISLTPSFMAYGTQTSGDKSAAKTITLKNNGTTTYTLGTIGQIGAFATDFTYTTTCAATVAAGKTCTFSVTFEPTASEAANSQLTITASNGSVIGVQMQGQGNIPIYLTPRNMSFPATLLGTTSASKTDVFTNKSGVNIIFTKIDLEGVNQTDFSISPTSSCLTLPNATLLPGQSCQSQVTFHPTVNPAILETVTQVYYGNFTLVKQGLLINGLGTAVKVSPTSITFPTAAVGTTTTAVVTFQNAGPTAMEISSANFINGTANVFSIQSNTCNFVQGTGGSVPANSSCKFTLGFTPTVTGTQTATFQIGDSDITGPQLVSLTGTGD